MGNGPITCRMAPSDGMRRMLGQLGVDPREQRNIAAMLDDVVAVDALAQLLDEGMGVVVAKDGRLDTKDLAAFLLRRIREHQR